MSRILPSGPEIQKSFGQDAIRFFDQAVAIADMGDGIKAFCGVMAAVLASDVRIVLIDEPEAFLHPPTARKLGTNLVILGAERQGSLVVSTHSADVLMGCVQAGKCLNIVRLTYQEDMATARLLPPDEIRQLMLDPLLRSTAVLSALFYRGAVVCEGDSDRVLYQEINERLIASGQPGCADCVFLNAQNKSTIRRIIEPLRKMGVPAAAVVDLDILKGDDLKDLLRAASVPDGVVKGLGQLRGEIEAAFKRGGRDPGKDGIDALAGDERESAQKLLSDLKEYGIFVVPVGNLERWLPELNVVGEKSQWLSNVLTALGSDPGSARYVLPKAGDVWSFIEEIGHWIVNPHRKGVPD